MKPNQWISVMDKLPTGRCFCLVAMRIGDEEKPASVRMAHFDAERAATGGHLFTGEEIHYDVHTITHWMPLPQLPKAKS